MRTVVEADGVDDPRAEVVHIKDDALGHLVRLGVRVRLGVGVGARPRVRVKLRLRLRVGLGQGWGWG